MKAAGVRLAGLVLAAGLATSGARAGVVTLYDEAVSGDLSTSGALGFALPSGLSAVRGRLAAHIGASGAVDTDIDQFRITIGSGYELAGVTVGYTADATRGTAQSVAGHVLQRTTGGPQAYETVSGPSGTYAGTETLFDVIGPFAPIQGGSGEYAFAVFFDSLGGPDTSFNYRYDLVFEVQPTAVLSVPEPTGLSLGAVALAAGLAATTWRTRRGRPGRPPGA